MKYECPECHRPLASRRHKRCQYCGAELPQHLLVTQAETDAEFRAWKKADKQRQAHQAEADAEESANRASLDSTAGGVGL